MRPVLAEPIPEDQMDKMWARGRGVAQPRALPARDPLGDRHLAAVTGFIAEAESFPDAEADRVDAELAEDHLEPEQRIPAPAALDSRNVGTMAASPAETCAEHGPHPGTVDCVDCLHRDRLERAAEVGVTVHRPEPVGPSAFTKLAQKEGIVPGPEETDRHPGTESRGADRLDEVEESMPGPEETAPLPAGWESREEQELAAEATTEVPKGLGPQLQEAAARHAVEDKLIRKIQAATSVRGPDGLLDLHSRALQAGYWSDRVKAAASARRQELEAAG
jgi:hypothetical protein